MNFAILTPTKDMPREEWLNYRRCGIGGSDAAAILGLNNNISPYSVWADKLGLLPEKEETEAMRQGRDFENYVAMRFCEKTGKRVRRSNKILRSQNHSFMLANIDREIIGENAGLECKTTSIMNLKKFKNGEFPAEYYCQCMHYLAVTGWQKWYLAVLVLNQRFYVFEIERDEEEIAALVNAESEFWKLVESKTPPPADGTKATTEAIQTIYADSSDDAIELFGRETLLQDYYIQKAIRDSANDKMEEIKQVFMLDLGNNETGFCGSYKITWKRQSRQTFDTKRFVSDYSNIQLNEYYQTKVFRKFDIREIR